MSRIVAIQPKKITIGDVVGAVAEHCDIPEKAILSQNRAREVARARHIALYLTKELTDCSLTEIGFKMGKRSHATVLHSIALVNERLEYDPVLRQTIAQIEAQLKY